MDGLCQEPPGMDPLPVTEYRQSVIWPVPSPKAAAQSPFMLPQPPTNPPPPAWRTRAAASALRKLLGDPKEEDTYGEPDTSDGGGFVSRHFSARSPAPLCALLYGTLRKPDQGPRASALHQGMSLSTTGK